MGCEQLVQHAKVSKNRKFIPHFRENLARPLDKGGVGVVYLPCNPQSAASVREVINTANRLIHRVTAEVINPFQQLSTLYRHVVDTSPPPSGAPPLRFTAAPQHCSIGSQPHRYPVSRCTAALSPGFPLHRSPQHRFICIAPPFSRRATALPSCFRCTASLLHRSISVFFPLYRGTALPLLRFISVQRHCSTGLPFAALPLRRFAGFGPFCSKTLSCSLFFLFRDASPPPFPGMSVCPASAPAGYPEASATEPPTRRQLSAPHPKSRSTSWLGRFHPRRSNRGPCGSAAPERRMEGRGVGGVRGAGAVEERRRT